MSRTSLESLTSYAVVADAGITVLLAQVVIDLIKKRVYLLERVGLLLGVGGTGRESGCGQTPTTKFGSPAAPSVAPGHTYGREVRSGRTSSWCQLRCPIAAAKAWQEPPRVLHVGQVLVAEFLHHEGLFFAHSGNAQNADP